jgi:hypothetical protein
LVSRGLDLSAIGKREGGHSRREASGGVTLRKSPFG